MVKRTGRSIRKAKKKLKKSVGERGKLSLTKYFAKFKDGERVVLKADSAVQTGTYHMRFHGKMGTVGEKQGRCYEVVIKDGAKQKTLILHPVHLKRI